jgi:small subunit ribosomal protein S20
MANHASARKRIRQNTRRAHVNRQRLGAVRTYVRKVEEAIANGNKESARASFQIAEPKLARGTQKGIIEKNTMRRKLSRLSARIKAMPA